ncbi:hypothetical protein D9756_006935 [Leucocoprinus leucothites]|uniref:Uncharacterized protein n=1 Tax=Leucocoprinus leucothites TaxID=201217 RepID=A0A8H5FZ08_9AGAR|nr:hypothetical protein D9756_006935 [Leucoagaricus leucothites]
MMAPGPSRSPSSVLNKPRPMSGVSGSSSSRLSRTTGTTSGSGNSFNTSAIAASTPPSSFSLHAPVSPPPLRPPSLVANLPVTPATATAIPNDVNVTPPPPPRTRNSIAGSSASILTTPTLVNKTELPPTPRSEYENETVASWSRLPVRTNNDNQHASMPVMNMNGMGMTGGMNGAASGVTVPKVDSANAMVNHRGDAPQQAAAVVNRMNGTPSARPMSSELELKFGGRFDVEFDHNHRDDREGGGVNVGGGASGEDGGASVSASASASTTTVTPGTPTPAMSPGLGEAMTSALDSKDKEYEREKERKEKRDAKEKEKVKESKDTKDKEKEREERRERRREKERRREERREKRERSKSRSKSDEAKKSTTGASLPQPPVTGSGARSSVAGAELLAAAGIAVQEIVDIPDDGVHADAEKSADFHSVQEDPELLQEGQEEPPQPELNPEHAFEHLMLSPHPLITDLLSREKRRINKNGAFTLADFVSDAELLQTLLQYMTFYDWCLLASVSRVIRIVMVQKKNVKEEILERFLSGTVGYRRWSWEDPEPLSLSIQDLSDYMRGVSTPTHEYARIANLYVQSLSIHPQARDPMIVDTVRALTASTRAYTRVVLRLRAQAEKEQAVYSAMIKKQQAMNPAYGSPHSPYRSGPSSRAPSPTYSSFSHSQHHLPQSRTHSPSLPPLPNQHPQQQGITFRSPLFRLRRAPLLRVFVPSPEGDWLSDKSVLECEAECKRAGVTKLLRMGDVIWDIAVGDEGNVGRLIWDGSYLIDLDYTYSPTGELPKYMPALAFPPSYFHRVIRPGSTSTNPIVQIDLSPWGEEIAANLQLLQDRVRTETPQGAYHNVVRWVHRSSFVIRPPSRQPSVRAPTPSSNGHGYANGIPKMPVIGRIPISGTDNLYVDPGWYGTIVVEAEGTNESLADLQDRCGPGVFPPRVRGAHVSVTQAQAENRKVFRILRERSRPGEIWIKCVSVKERLL